MASLCKRQQCTIERRGFRQELDSWRHKLIHCVGKLACSCVCARVWLGPAGAGTSVLGFGLFSVRAASRGRNVHRKKPTGSARSCHFFVTHGYCLALPASHRTYPKYLINKFVSSCRQVFSPHALCLWPVDWCLVTEIRGLEPRACFFRYYSLAVYLLWAGRVTCAVGAAPQPIGFRLRLAWPCPRARHRVEFLVGGAVRALSVQTWRPTFSSPSLRRPGNRLLGARIAALVENVSGGNNLVF